LKWALRCPIVAASNRRHHGESLSPSNEVHRSREEGVEGRRRSPAVSVVEQAQSGPDGRCAWATFKADGFNVEVFKGKSPSVPVYLKETNDDGTRWLKINAQVGYEVFNK